MPKNRDSLSDRLKKRFQYVYMLTRLIGAIRMMTSKHCAKWDCFAPPPPHAPIESCSLLLFLTCIAQNLTAVLICITEIVIVFSKHFLHHSLVDTICITEIVLVLVLCTIEQVEVVERLLV